ncbi:MAG: hypothetical protein II010_05960, partial [Oscillospiraceae bacterium]|nr:hypothetical protein [Oscillospiraceae bacterium]
MLLFLFCVQRSLLENWDFSFSLRLAIMESLKGPHHTLLTGVRAFVSCGEAENAACLCRATGRAGSGLHPFAA